LFPQYLAKEAKIMGIATARHKAPTTVNSRVQRTREYLTQREIERLMEAGRKTSRYGHRDATMILIAYRHGLRASELCDLQWAQIELNTGRLHVRRSKRGTPSVHPYALCRPVPAPLPNLRPIGTATFRRMLISVWYCHFFLVTPIVGKVG
jgi:integrase